MADIDYLAHAEIEWEATQRAAAHRNDLASLDRDARGYVHTRRDGVVEVLPYGWYPLAAPPGVPTYDRPQAPRQMPVAEIVYCRCRGPAHSPGCPCDDGTPVAMPAPPPPAVQTEVAVLDTETTGLERDARITELAVVIVSLPSGRIVSHCARLFDPGMPIPRLVRDLTGITDEMCAGQPAFADRWARIVAFVGSRPVVAHNASFDRGKIEYELDRAFLSRPAWRWFCSKTLAARVLPERKKLHKAYSLQTLADDLRLSRGTAHRALGDCLTTAALLHHLARGRAWAEWAGEPAAVWVPTVREPAAQTPLLMIGGIR